MKLIKFNLSLNGTSIGTLDQLQKNFTAEVLVHFRSGKLIKWLRVRSLTDQAEKLDQLFDEDNNREIQLFKKLNEIFGIEINETTKETILAERKKLSPSTQQTVDDEIKIFAEKFAKKEFEHQRIIEKTQEDMELIAQEWTERESVHHAEIKELIDAMTKINLKHADLCKSIIPIYKASIQNDRAPTYFFNFMESVGASIKETNSIRNAILSRFSSPLIS